MNINNTSEKAKKLANLANHFLESSSINWQLGLDLYNKLILFPGHESLTSLLIKRVVELKPNLVKRFGIEDRSLTEIAERHQEIVLNDKFLMNKNFDIKTINSQNDFELFAYSIFEDVLKNINIKKINSKSKVFGFGSCFAVNFINHLNHLNINASSSVLSEDINSPVNNIMLLKFILQEIQSDFVGELLRLNKDFDVEQIRSSIIHSSHIVLTLGSAFHLVSDQEKNILIPTKSSKTVVANFQDLLSAVNEIFDLIRKFNNKATIFLTVSPIPLKGVMGQSSAINANILSKSLLRSVVNYLDHDKFTYLPLYDILNAAAGYSNRAFFGLDDGNSRHLNGDVIKILMNTVTSFIVE
jgi:hypothetical protein